MSAKQYGIPIPVQFDRLYSGPLEKYDTFETYAEALTYAQSPRSYEGQRIGVKKSDLKEDVYVINPDKSLSRLVVQRDDIYAVLKKDRWVGDSVPYEQAIAVPHLDSTDNCIVSLSDTVTDPEIIREIVNAKIGDVRQGEGSITFVANGAIPTVDIPIKITAGSIVSAVEIPNNVNDNTNHTVVIAKKDAWEGTKPPYMQELYVFGVRPDSNGTVGINPDGPYSQLDKMTATTAGVVKYEQGNNTITLAAMNSKPTRDLEILVVWGDEIVVFENSDTLEDFNTTHDLVLKANEWSNNKPYTQTVKVEGLSEYHTGAIGLSQNCTVEEAEVGLNAGIELIEQGNGYVVVQANDIKPIIDLPIYLTYGANITIVPSPEYVGEANRHVDTTAYASKWIKTVDGWQQEIDVEGITSNSIGTMGLRNGTSEIQSYAAAVAKIKITKVYDDKVLLTATGLRPTVNIPLAFVFGRNINVVKYPGVVGKMALDANYIAFDDTMINSGLYTVQQILEYFNENDINLENNISDLRNESISQHNEFKKLLKENADDHLIIKNSISSLEIANTIEHNVLRQSVTDLTNANNTAHTNINKSITDLTNANNTAHNTMNTNITNLQNSVGDVVFKVQSTQPAAIQGKNVVWIKI